ncbi:hypothetical protein MTO96_043431, partial [Rhipicephalus appendiculatus]
MAVKACITVIAVVYAVQIICGAGEVLDGEDTVD